MIYYFSNPALCKVLSKQWPPHWIIISIFMANCSRVLLLPWGMRSHMTRDLAAIGEWSLRCSQLDSTACLFSFAIVICNIRLILFISVGVKNVLWRWAWWQVAIKTGRNDCHVACKYVEHVSPQVICLYGVNKGIFSRGMHESDVHTICPVCC